MTPSTSTTSCCSFLEADPCIPVVAPGLGLGLWRNFQACLHTSDPSCTLSVCKHNYELRNLRFTGTNTDLLMCSIQTGSGYWSAPSFFLDPSFFFSLRFSHKNHCEISCRISSRSCSVRLTPPHHDGYYLFTSNSCNFIPFNSQTTNIQTHTADFTRRTETQTGLHQWN